MSRVRLLVAGLVFALALVLGTGVAGFLRGGGKAEAQESTTTIVPGKRVVRPTSNFDLDVMVDGRPLAEYYSRGETFVQALRGAEYELRIRNPSGNRVAVALFVDGLNTVDASRTSAWDASKWVIEPYETITINGWQMSSERARRFYFTTERDSYAAKRGSTANIGVISAVFFRERRRVVVPVTPGYPSSRDEGQAASMESRAESRAPSAKSRSREDAATGIGRSIRHDVDWIDMELESRPAAEVTIRYEYCCLR